MTTDVNLLIRGQSNALLFVADGGAASLERQIEAQLPGVDIHILASYNEADSSIYAGTAFLDWDSDGEQQGLLNFLRSEPAGVRDNPTVTLWMHNEYDGNTPGVTAAKWVSEVTADAALVRAALGQGSATTPYVFTYVPYNYVKGDSWQQIQNGMNQLSADAGFNATFDSTAMNGLQMDGDGYANSSHMGTADAMRVADQLAATMAATVAGLTGGKPVAPRPVTPAPIIDTTPLIKTVGSGSDALVLKISQDAYLAGAQYTVSVDGKQIGGTLTAGASHAAGQDDIITVKGDWTAGAHKVTVSFLNDAWDGGGGDRNLYVDGITYNGAAVSGGKASLLSAGPVDFAFTEAAAPIIDTTPLIKTIGSGSDTLVLKISQDAYLAGAQYTVSVDGKQIGGTLTAGASHAAGQDDIITVKGDWTAGAHKVTVSFLNDAWDGGGGDRNLYVDGITYNGAAVSGGKASLLSAGPVDFAFTQVAAPVVSSPPPPVVTPVPSTGTGPGPIPAQFGAAGAWGQDSQVWTGHLNYGGTSYETFGAKPAWGGLSTVQAAPKAWDAAWDSHIAIDNFVTANLDLRAAGTKALDVLVVSAQNGTVLLGEGNDTITWVAHRSETISGNKMVMNTGAGDDVVHITAAGLSPLADYDKTGNGSLYKPGYDGTGSTANVTLGAGHDTVTTEGGVQLILHGGAGFATATGGKAADLFYAGTGGGDFTGGAGKDTFIFERNDGHVTIEDFTSGTDKLKFVGLTKADIHTAATTEGGVGGLLVTYDSAGDSVFLAHVTKIAASDMLFA